MHTCPCNEYPITSHFNYAVKLAMGICFMHSFYDVFLLQSIDCGYSSRGGSHVYPQSMFEQKYSKKITENFLMFSTTSVNYMVVLSSCHQENMSV